MVSWRYISLVVAVVVLLTAAGIYLVEKRLRTCLPIPFVNPDMLPNSAFNPDPNSRLPQGWSRGANGVELRGRAIDADVKKHGFDLNNDGRSLQLIGIANYVATPVTLVQPGRSYCFQSYALTDSDHGSTTRLQVKFYWLDLFGQELAQDTSDWQPVVLWRQDAPPRSWSKIQARFHAPPRAAQLRVQIHTASDDRVYIDTPHIRWTTHADQAITTSEGTHDLPVVQPWPDGYQAALSFSFDWETSMGGLIHTRSSLTDDPYNMRDPVERGLRMRQGVTETLTLFRPYGIRATYYASGYNFLYGNVERRTFMNNPTFSWATVQHGWPIDWSKRLWFSSDPFGTIQSQPAWYFGDLIPSLQNEKQDIQSHTFSHLYGGYAEPTEWQADFAAWNEVAQAQDVPTASSLAFPWSSSAGMSDDNWRELERAGIKSVTRTNWTQDQYDLFGRDERGFTALPQCRPIPGHETILACPDFYLTVERADLARQQIDTTLAVGGMIDLWAHPEEVVDRTQIVAWSKVIQYAVQQRTIRKLWIAPLSEIADWQQASANVIVTREDENIRHPDEPLHMRITNQSHRDLSGLTLQFPFAVQRVSEGITVLDASRVVLHTLPQNQSLNVTVWPMK